MALEKKIHKSEVDPESTEWLFEQGFIEFVAGPEGLDIRVTEEGMKFLDAGEDHDVYMSRRAEEVVAVQKPLGKKIWMRVLMAIVYLVILVCIFKKTKG